MASLGVLLATQAAFSQARLWRATLLDPALAIPGLDRRAPDTALIGGTESSTLRGMAPPAGAGLPAPGRRLEWRSDAGWQGILHREGEAESEILAASTTQSLWLRMAGGTVLGLIGSGRLDRNRNLEPGELETRLGDDRRSLGGVWIQSLLPRAGEEGASGDAPFLDMAARIADIRMQGYQWMLAGGRTGRWRVEYGFIQEEILETARILNLDTAGSGEKISGSYRARFIGHRLVAMAPVAGGTASLLAQYGFGRPRRPQSEFWFCDSSRQLRGRLAYRRPFAAGAWEAWGDFQEAEAYSIGRRIPAGSEGVKRFHFARNHGTLRELGAAVFLPVSVAADGPTAGSWAWRLGALYRGLDGTSRPPEDALDSRRETLSYNRLGVSFIANLYGGLFKMSELIQGEAALGTAEVFGGGEGRWGLLRAGADLSAWRAGLMAEASGRTLEQKLLAVDTSDTFRIRYQGWVAGLTPRLTAALRLPYITVEAEAAQALPIFSDIRREGAAGSARAEVDESRYALGRNGFAARARLVAGF